MTQKSASRALIFGLFLFLAAAACAVAPIPLVFRSAGVLLFSYAAFTFSGSQAALFISLVAPVVGLLSGSTEWLVMLPIILASNLLGMLGLEYAWRYAAIFVSPLLVVAPQAVSMVLSRQELFEVELPWADGAMAWIALHGLVALFGVLAALFWDRRFRQGQEKSRSGSPEAV